MNHDIEFFPLFIIAALAWLTPIIASQLKPIIRIPTVILEIIVGVIIGKSGFNIINGSQHYLDFLYLTGFVFLMFLSGLEIDTPALFTQFPQKRTKLINYIKNPLISGVLFFIITFIITFSFSFFISSGIEIRHSWFLALALSTTSVGIVIPVLKERGELAENLGQSIIISAMVADFATIFLISMATAVLMKGWNLEAFIILSLFFITYLIYRIMSAASSIRILSTISNQLAHASTQIKVRGTIALLLAMVVFSEVIGAELILGAFFAGLILSLFVSKERSILSLKLDAMGYGFFIPVFFIMVGINFDLDSLMTMEHTTGLIVGLLAIAFAAKLLPSFLFVPSFGWRRALAAGFLLSSRLSLIIAAAEIGMRLQIIKPGIGAALIAVAVVACLLSPIIYSKLYRQEAAKGSKTIIIGGGKIGRNLGHRLKMHKKRSIIIDIDPNSVKKTHNMGLTALTADGRDPLVYKSIELSPDDYVVVVTGSDQVNIDTCQMLKAYYGHKKIIARDNNPDNERLLRWMGVIPMNFVMSAAMTLENLVLRPSTYHMIIESLQSFEVYDVVMTNSELEKVPIRDIPFHKDGFLLLVKRGEHQRIPHGDFSLKMGDNITIFGTSAAIDDISHLLKGS
jgi:Kef-type K+ transport system membrane component KefB/Trk K+ transport system NAD-binding subunit